MKKTGKNYSKNKDKMRIRQKFKGKPNKCMDSIYTF